MANKTIFSIDGKGISTLFSTIFGSIKNMRFVAKSKNGSNILNLPIWVAILVAIAFPLSLILGLVISMILKIKIVIEKEVQQNPKIIELQ